MKTSKQWAEIYMVSPVLKLEEVIRLAQSEAIEDAVYACDKNIVSASIRSTWDKIEQQLKSEL